jgi:hypothetical protein
MEESKNENRLTTRWYHYLLAFLAGMFLMNVLPHLIKGVTGTAFPTPFSDPPGRAPSSPTLNVIWAFINLAIGSSLFHFFKIGKRSPRTWLVLMIGALAIALQLASHFEVYGH